jgi:Fic family protein
MVFNPRIDESRLAPLISDLASLRQEIGAVDVHPLLTRWLRREVEARGAHMSTSIEGNPMTETEVRELFARHRESVDRAELENLDYRDAARFARQVAGDPTGEVDAGMLRALHYLVVRSTYPLDSSAQWRQHQNRVADASGRTVYMPPPPSEVHRLVDELIEWLMANRRIMPHLVLAAVAHLEFVNIHPFDDGNGRTARALTTYMLERHGWGLRGFVSSEAAFGRDRAAYYAALRALGERYENRTNDVTDWCIYLFRCFAIEASTALGVVQRWNTFATSSDQQTAGAEDFANGHLYLSLVGSVSRSEYAEALRVSPATAVKQLNLLVERGIARREGRGRATRYRSTDELAQRIFDEAYEQALARFPEP